MALELRDLASSPPLNAPGAVAFSKLRYMTGLSDPEGLEFFNGLFHAAVLSKEDGDWSRVEAFLEEWETRLVSRARPDALRFDSAPWAPFKGPLRKARVALISTGGIYVKGSQEPYNTEGDASFRVIPASTPREALGVAHTHYDTAGALQDINVVFPYERLKEMAAEGAVGSLAHPCYGFMGYIVRDLVHTLITETAPEVARRLLADKVNAVLIGST